MLLFLDANVLFAAAYRGEGNARAIFHLAPLTGTTLASSTFAVEEAARNLRLKAPAAEAELVTLMDSITMAGGPDRRALERASKHGLPEKDVPILAAAMAIRASLLATGDRHHFGPRYGRKISGVEILPPADAGARLLQRLEASSKAPVPRG